MSTSNPAADRLGVALARAHGCAVTLSGYRSLVLAPDVRTSLDGYDAADRATSELLASMAEAITVARSISGDRTSHPQVRRRAAAAVASLEALGKDVMWPGGVGWARRTLAVQVRRTAHVTERLAGVSAVQGGTSATTARPNRCSVWLVNTTVRLLPRESQDRYAEEFRSELLDLARSGRSGWVQLLYAARLIDRGLELRGALTATTRPRASG